MYLELSRPDGDVSRWEKVLKRLILLNKHYPMKDARCNSLDFMRSFESGSSEERQNIYTTVRDALVDQGVVFFGGYAATLYGRYMPEAERRRLSKNPDFDVLSDDPETSAVIVKERLEQEGFKKVTIVAKPAVGENISPHYEVVVGKETVCFIYEPLACHSYNTLRIGNRDVKVATIDTMLSFYLAFLYADRPYYDHHRILCMAQYLFTVQAKNRLKQTGLLKRFSISCYGSQPSLEEMRAEKARKHKELRDRRGTKEYDEWFLRYEPSAKDGAPKRECAKEYGAKERGTKERGTKERSTKKPIAKKRSAKKRSAKKRGTKKRGTKTRDTKKQCGK